MKFKNIPQYPRSYYQVDIYLGSLKKTLAEYKRDQEAIGQKFELNPDFQRGNVWTPLQQKHYTEYVLKGGDSGREIYFNHSGWMSHLNADMVCIDGLQRLTAMLAFLNNELPIFEGHFYKDFEDSISRMKTLIFHVMVLPTRIDILEWYLAFNRGGTTHSQEALNKAEGLLEIEKAKLKEKE